MAADKSVRVELHGVRELQRAFKAVGGDTQNRLKAEFLEIARTVANATKSKVPHQSGRAAESIKPRSTARGGAIAFGGQAAPYMPWLDFGGSVGRGHSPGRSWSGAIKREWRGASVGSGRYVYPTISEYREETAKAADEAIEKAAKSAGFETHG